ncbi:MAG: rhodanese-like domain-containing protein [Burkholderiales bacterium]
MQFLIDNLFIIAVAFVSGGMLVWPLVNRQLAGATVNTLAATRLINDGAVILDVRDNAAWAAGHLNGSRNIPLTELQQRAAELPSGKAVVVACESGNRSAKAAAALRKAGRSEVFCLEGGINAWKQAGLPVSKSRF